MKVGLSPTGLRWFLLTVALSCTTLLALVFALWELVERRYFRDLDYVTLHYLYITRGIASSLLIGFWATWFVLRERRLHDEQLEQSYERYRSILNNMPEAVALLDDSFRILEWNEAAEKLFGFDRGQVLGHELLTVPAERRPELREVLGRVASDQGVLDYETERRTAQGERIPVAVSYARIPPVANQPQLFVEVAQDIRPRLRMRDKLLELEKLTLMGQMAAGTAHHLNTPLTAMLLRVELLRQQGRDLSHSSELAAIEQRIRFCQVFVQNLLQFARRPQLQQKPILLSEVIEAVVTLFRAESEPQARHPAFRLRRDPPLPHPRRREPSGSHVLGSAEQRRGCDSAGGMYSRSRLCPNRPRRGSPRGRQRPWDRQRSLATRLRALFHNQAGGTGNRTGTGNCTEHRRRPQRRVASPKSRRRRHARDRAAAPPQRRRSLGRSGETYMSKQCRGGSLGILVVDDDEGLATSLAKVLQQRYPRVHTALSAAEAAAILAREKNICIALVDLVMPLTDGLGLLDLVRQSHPDVSVILMTGFGTIETAVEAIKRGAEDYITKPFDSETVLKKVSLVMELYELKERVAQLEGQRERESSFAEIVAASPVMLSVLERVRVAAMSSAPVLLVGETGTGKEMLARAIHRGSPRAGGSFIPVNCAAIPHELFESELFGHRKGAFTSAVADHRGLFQAAHGGTLFLDEITEVPIGTQAKLLRVLEDGEVRRVGETTPLHVDIRLVSASNRPLAEIASGGLREDLFFRISTIVIQVPRFGIGTKISTCSSNIFSSVSAANPAAAFRWSERRWTAYSAILFPATFGNSRTSWKVQWRPPRTVPR